MHRWCVAIQGPEGIVPVALRFAVDGDADVLDQRWTDAGIIETEHRALRRHERADLDPRPHLGAIVRALKTRLVDANDDSRHAHHERGEGDEGLRLAVPGSGVGHGVKIERREAGAGMRLGVLALPHLAPMPVVPAYLCCQFLPDLESHAWPTRQR